MEDNTDYAINKCKDKIQLLNLRASELLEELEELSSNILTRSADKSTSSRIKEIQEELSTIESLQDCFRLVKAQNQHSNQQSNFSYQSVTSDFNLPSDLPEFRTGSDRSTTNPESFLGRYEQKLEAHNVPTSRWTSILPTCCSNLVASWISINIPKCTEWKRCKEIFSSHYVDPQASFLRKQQIYKSTMRHHEPLINFLDRFSYLVKSLPDSESSEYVDLLTSKLPINYQKELLKINLFKPLKTLEEVISVVSAFELIDTRTTSNSYQKSELTVEPSINQVIKPQYVRKTERCGYCSRDGHPEDKCFKKHPQLKPNHLKIQKINVQNDKDPIKVITPKNPNYTVALTLNTTPCIATIDTGANVSILSTRFVKTNNIPTKPVTGTVHLARNGMSFTRIGKTLPIKVCMDAKCMTYSFEVFETQEDTDCLVGQDLFEALGLTIQGLPRLTKNTETSDMSFDVLESHSLESCSPIQHGLVEAQKFIQESVFQNEKLPHNSFCTVPEALVDLDTGTQPPVYRKQMPPVPHTLHVFVDKKIQEWIDSKRIELCPGSAYHSPLLVSEKMENNVPTLSRLCLDPRHLNMQLADVNYPMPIIRELFEKLAGHKVFSKLDLKESFLQFPLNPLHRHKTAFSWKGQLYQFAGTPFGLKHITYVFQKVMNSILKDMPFALAYVDDIIIFSNSIQEHKHHVKAVVDCLTSVNLRLKIPKCVFFQEKIKLLGHSISGAGMQIDQEKMDAAINWDLPCNGKQIQQFLGLTNYFREFIPNYSAVTAPLDRLRNAKALEARDWPQEALRNFETFVRINTGCPC